jgi:hypothetical protein
MYYTVAARASQFLMMLEAAFSSPERRRRGASLVEYVLLISLMALACFVAAKYLGSETAKPYSGAASGLDS